jgi:hypothetical protein
MNISHGIYRLAQLIKWAGRIIGAIYIVSFVSANFFTEKNATSDAFLFGGLLILFLAITEGIAWVLEGFSND